MPDSRFDVLSSFLKKRYKLVILCWIIGLVAIGSQIPTFFGAVSYNVAGSNFGGPSNAESQVAQNIFNAQFPSQNNTGGNGIIVVLQNGQMYSPAVQSAVIGLNKSLASDPALSGSFQGMSSLYSTEYSFLVSLVPSLLPQVAQANATIASMDGGAVSSGTSSWDAASARRRSSQSASPRSPHSSPLSARAPAHLRSGPASRPPSSTRATCSTPSCCRAR